MTSERRPRILLADDDPAGRAAMSEWLEREGYEPLAVADGKEAIARMHDGIELIVTDLKMPGVDGLALLQAARQKAPHAPVILISGHGTVDTAVQALKQGAFDFLSKPVNLKELSHRIHLALENRKMAQQIAELHRQLKQRTAIDNMVGRSAAMRDLFEKIQLVADTNSTVLIVGESGTGKELVARALHENSARRDRPFVPVNCAAIPETLVESELFGHERGAFTGATHAREGLFRSADGGTLLIDEIGELPLGLQGKLLRAIESKRIMPVGSTAEIAVDVRLVAATNRELQEQVKQKEFREDLYYRLKVVVLRLPPLRERRSDIPLLVRHFIDEIATANQRPVREISPEALKLLTQFDWPGNVRELRNTLEGAIVLSLNERLEASDLPDNLRDHAPATSSLTEGLTIAELEREAIRSALKSTHGHRADAAKRLGLSVRTLQRKIKEYELT